MLSLLRRLCKEPRLILRRLFECVFVWGEPTPRGNLQDAQLIVTQAMPDCAGGASSDTNVAIADLAQHLHDKLGIPIFPQAEVGKILETRGVPLVGNTLFYGNVSLLADEYIGSHGIARLQKNLCDEHGWTKVLLVVPFPHAWRALWIYERLGLKVIVPPGLPKIKFQRNLTQRRWRRAITAYPYELLARLISLYMGVI